MNESQWDEKLRTFLKKTGDDLKRAGTDIKVEAEKLMKEVQDPNRQEKVKKGLETFKVWAKKTAEEVASVVETGVKKAEGAVRGAVDTVQPPPPASSPEAPPAPPPSHETTVEPMRHDTPVDTPVASAAPAAPAAPAKKTIGGAKKKAAAKPKGASKKPLGKKRTP